MMFQTVPGLFLTSHASYVLRDCVSVIIITVLFSVHEKTCPQSVSHCMIVAQWCTHTSPEVLLLLHLHRSNSHSPTALPNADLLGNGFCIRPA